MIAFALAMRDGFGDETLVRQGTLRRGLARLCFVLTRDGLPAPPINCDEGGTDRPPGP
jgi:hypothetical protein